MGDAKGGDGVLRLSLPGEPRTLNPNVAPLDEYALLVSQNLFSRLVTRADDSGVLPELAERWTESADGLTYTFYIRKGVRFHDGRPLTAEDVRTTFARIAESSNTEVAQRIASVEAPDPTTVHVRLKAPWAAFIPSIAWFGVSILPSHVYAGAPWKDNPANVKPIGSGPFKLKTWEPGRRIVLEKNPDFFGQGPYLDELDYTIVPSTAEGVQLLLDGQVDFVMGRPPPRMVRQLARTPGLRVTMAPSDGRTYLAFNLRREPFDDVRLRRAVNLALDRRALIDDVLSGLGSPAVGFYTPAVAWALQRRGARARSRSGGGPADRERTQAWRHQVRIPGHAGRAADADGDGDRRTARGRRLPRRGRADSAGPIRAAPARRPGFRPGDPQRRAGTGSRFDDHAFWIGGVAAGHGLRECRARSRA